MILIKNMKWKKSVSAEIAEALFFALQESPVKQKTLREDAHSREIEICRKRPRSAREFCKQNSLFLMLPAGIEPATDP